MFYINKLGILRAATSLSEWAPALGANVYYGSWEHGAYGIFSTKELESSRSAEEQKTAAQLLAVGFHDAETTSGVLTFSRYEGCTLTLKREKLWKCNDLP